MGAVSRSGQCPLLPEHHTGREHTHAEPRHLPDRGSLVQPAKGKIERVGRGEGKRGQRRSEEELEQSCVCLKDALEPLARPSQMPTPPSHFSPALVTTLTLFPPGQVHPTLLGAPPTHPVPPGSVLVDAALAWARELLLLGRRGGQGQPHAGCAVVDAAGTGSGRRGDRD